MILDLKKFGTTLISRQNGREAFAAEHCPGLSPVPVKLDPETAVTVLGALAKAPSELFVVQLQDALARHYAGSQWVTVEPVGDSTSIDALALNDTNKMELRVFGNEEFRHAVLIARLDNLGKGASGAAVQNLELMLGL